MSVFLGGVIGFLVGMAINAYLLQGVARDRLRGDPRLRWRYGLLNWAVAALGAVIAAVLQRLP